MIRYWLDTSVFLGAALGDLAFDLNPTFWENLEADAISGLIGAPMFVHREIVELSGRDDEVARWATQLKNEGVLFIEPDEDALAAFSTIADYVYRNADPSEADGFLDDADPWVIAHAIVGATVVVSQEKSVGAGSRRLKVPNLCAHFLVGCIKTDQFLREIKEMRERG